MPADKATATNYTGIVMIANATDLLGLSNIEHTTVMVRRISLIPSNPPWKVLNQGWLIGVREQQLTRLGKECPVLLID